MFTPHPSVFKYFKFCPSQAWWFSKITKYFKGFFKPHLSVFTYFQIPSKPILAVSQDLPRLSHSPQTKPLGFEVFSNSVQSNPGGFTKFSNIFRSCSNQAPRFSNMFKLRASQPWRFYKIFFVSNYVQTKLPDFQMSKFRPSQPWRFSKIFQDVPILCKPHPSVFRSFRILFQPRRFSKISKISQLSSNHTPRFGNPFEFCPGQPWRFSMILKYFPFCSNQAILFKPSHSCFYEMKSTQFEFSC